MRLNKHLLSVAALAAGLALAGEANATSFTFDSTHTTFNTFYDYLGLDGANIHGEIAYSLSSLSSTSATFAVTVTNNSTGSGTNRLVSFGIDTIAPTLTSVSDSGTNAADWSETLNTNFPGFQTIDLCVWAGQNCSGGGNSGVLPTGTSSFNLILGYSAITSPFSITFTSPLPTKWQSVGTTGNSWELDATTTSECETDCGTVPPQSIPEPATLALVGLGVIGLGFASMRRPSQA
jgi:hypothetical protein